MNVCPPQNLLMHRFVHNKTLIPLSACFKINRRDEILMLRRILKVNHAGHLAAFFLYYNLHRVGTPVFPGVFILLNDFFFHGGFTFVEPFQLFLKGAARNRLGVPPMICLLKPMSST